jgi:hypothetical protein
VLGSHSSPGAKLCGSLAKELFVTPANEILLIFRFLAARYGREGSGFLLVLGLFGL